MHSALHDKYSILDEGKMSVMMEMVMMVNVDEETEAQKGGDFLKQQH